VRPTFPEHPASWYLFAPSARLRRGPLSREVAGRRLVAYRTAAGRAVVLDARCCHLGADLGRGQVIGESIRCPFHHWEYGPDGRCVRIPAAEEVPDFARLARFPVEERHGLVFFFNGPQATFPLPSFPDRPPGQLVAARPWSYAVGCPWYMVAGNAFDIQHFAAAHDRRLLGPPRVERPAPHARRALCRLAVVGRSLQDRLTRLLAGPELEMSMTCWGGNIVLARAAFARTVSYGMVVVEPLAPARCLVQIIVFQPRSRSPLARALLDRPRLWVRRLAITRFLARDAGHLEGARYDPATLIDRDRPLADYFEWVAAAAGGGAEAPPGNGEVGRPATSPAPTGPLTQE
jgi:nitrite reductase/ring-hydroxylating ferredoxin subunit